MSDGKKAQGSAKMQRVLFGSTIFGPVRSRRLGVSLGINLMPDDGKMCSFDCLYCEAGYNAQGAGTTGVPTRKQVESQLKRRLAAMREAGEALDVITFSGNGEPTLHPDFPAIVADVKRLRNHYYPEARVTVLSNATMCRRPAVRKALLGVDNNILKLDSAVAATMRALNRPVSPNVLPEGLIADIAEYGGRCVVQTLFTRGTHDGNIVDNTTDAEVDALINAYLKIGPREVQVYTIDRQTPEHSLERIPSEELKAIAARIEAAGIKVMLIA